MGGGHAFTSLLYRYSAVRAMLDLGFMAVCV